MFYDFPPFFSVWCVNGVGLLVFTLLESRVGGITVLSGSLSLLARVET